MISSGKTDKGSKRNNNQDSIFMSNEPVGPLPNLYVVADGMGGHVAGDRASGMAIEILVRFIKESNLENPIAILKRAMIYANNEIYKAACEDSELNGMGTTMVVAVVIGNKLYVANVGDSRLYIINDEITQITMDHSLVEEMIRSGELERKKGRNHPKKNIITKAMGSKNEVIPDFFEIDLQSEDKILLCSDGLSNMVEDDEIKDILMDNFTLDDMTEALIDRANYYGGSDNISVVIISE